MTTTPSTSPTSSVASPAPSPLTAATVDDLSRSQAPMPTAKTLRQRTSLPLQAVRFGMVSLKMLRMVRKSHQH